MEKFILTPIEFSKESFYYFSPSEYLQIREEIRAKKNINDVQDMKNRYMEKQNKKTPKIEVTNEVILSFFGL